jgi:hypothetical protein
MAAKREDRPMNSKYKYNSYFIFNQSLFYITIIYST